MYTFYEKPFLCVKDCKCGDCEKLWVYFWKLLEKWEIVDVDIMQLDRSINILYFNYNIW